MFRNRVDAGRQLAILLTDIVSTAADCLVLALPRGGVPVASEVAHAFSVPLDVLVVRKLGAPFDPEYAFGAISRNSEFIDQALVERLGISATEVSEVTQRETLELARREKKYRSGKPPLNVSQKTVLLIDDGIATGATMRAAIKSVRSGGCKRVIVAVPVAPTDARSEFSGLADDFICVLEVENFRGVGQWYEAFPQVTDAEVLALLGS